MGQNTATCWQLVKKGRQQAPSFQTTLTWIWIDAPWHKLGFECVKRNKVDEIFRKIKKMLVALSFFWFLQIRNIHFFMFYAHSKTGSYEGVSIKIEVDVVWERKVACWRLFFYHFQRLARFCLLSRVIFGGAQHWSASFLFSDVKGSIGALVERWEYARAWHGMLVGG